MVRQCLGNREVGDSRIRVNLRSSPSVCKAGTLRYLNNRIYLSNENGQC